MSILEHVRACGSALGLSELMLSTLRGCCGTRAHAYEGRGAAWIPHGMRIPSMPGAHLLNAARPLVHTNRKICTHVTMMRSTRSALPAILSVGRDI